MKKIRLNFKEANMLIVSLHGLEENFHFIFQDKQRQEEQIRECCAKLRTDYAKDALDDISAEELKKSKAGIRVSALMEAGYTNLGKIARAGDWELKSIDGIGEKQLASIRSIISEFIHHLAAHETIRISSEYGTGGGFQNESAQGARTGELLAAIAQYRNGELVRRDAVGMTDELQDFAAQIASKKMIGTPVKWFFSGKKAKEQTIHALGEVLEFLNSPFCGRVKHFINLYREVSDISVAEASKDFQRHGADYYAILEKLGGMQKSGTILYGSIPEQLAAEIDALPLKLRGFYGNLRIYQEFGAKYILHQGRVLLGDEMGLGKTIQAIAAMVHLKEQDSEAHFLIVCPASVLVNWCREIKKFSTLDTWLVHGAFLEESFAQWQEKGGAAVTNFETMGKIVNRIDNHMKLALLVIDEAHYIKNPDAQRTENIRRLDNESERILLMTGTPLENRVEEMCSLLDFVRPDMSPQIRGAAHISGIPQFREMLAPVYLRRTRDQVLQELPPIEEKQEWCVMTDADCKAYVAAVKEHDFAGMRRVSFLQKELSDSAKARRILELCRDAKDEGRKVLIYSFFRETAGKVSALLEKACIGVINGDTEIMARQALIDRFAEAEDGSVLVCQIQAGGTGLNIQTASIVIFCEPQIKPSLTRQAISRVYRMGQVRNVLAYHLLCADTVDEAMVGRLLEKQAEFDAFADESVMGDVTESLQDREWIRTFIEEENKKYLPAVVG